MKSKADNAKLFEEASRLKEQIRLELHNKAYNKGEQNKAHKKNQNEEELAFS